MNIGLILIFAASTSVAPVETASHPAVESPNTPTPFAEAIAIADKAAADRGDRSAVAVLGTSHLSTLPKDYNIGNFSRLLDYLSAWQPHMIAVESLSGAQCDYLRSYAFAYPETAEGYCPNPVPARMALGLDGAKAEEEIEKLLAISAQTRPPETRRRLAMLFLANGDPTSALVQWLRLPAQERKADAVLTPAFVAELEKQATRRNENSIIAAPLAARLGHERVWLVDDHTGDRATGPLTGDAEKAFGEDMGKLWSNKWVEKRKVADDQWTIRIKAKTNASDEIVNWYRAMNSVEAAQDAVSSDFAAAAGDSGTRKTGRKYLAYWETRNLRMVANMREAMGPYPGARMLTIVGASHKPYYERYLGATSDVSIVDIDTILR